MAKKVLVVDDSITMRALFTSALEKSKDLVVVGAADGADEAREMIADLRPDVLTLDVEMPGKNGIEFLEELMETRPIPVVMLSTLTQKGADISLKAIEIGAVDCFPKPARATPDEFEKISGKLCKTVLTAAKTNLAARNAGKGKPAKAADYSDDGRVVAIAGGMGGMEAAADMLAAYPANCPPTLLVLTMEEGLAVPFASRLSKSIQPKVKVAGDGEALEAGTVYVAVDPERHVVIDRWPQGSVRLIDRPAVNGNRPSADLLFGALAKIAGASARGVLLSGGGQDGAAGLAALKGAGGQVFGQSPDSALVDECILAARERGLSAFAAPGNLAEMVLQADVAHAA
ncbi:protein-glutamate O-methylesterase CheB [Stakelama sediminis]|uniref:protein-glutamate methylesterase n=1 Tax=Stakelama sediminis TaxID=463200 RepID=A0A840YTY7_9SPHN|nr:chemotaxis protein CheB [Stakelama sediminis]MBB5717098.1 two-component system chemotaxis response regulator CheB [Stakelama sediminis]